jgi:hypothetical protein
MWWEVEAGTCPTSPEESRRPPSLGDPSMQQCLILNIDNSQLAIHLQVPLLFAARGLPQINHATEATTTGVSNAIPTKAIGSAE